MPESDAGSEMFYSLTGIMDRAPAVAGARIWTLLSRMRNRGCGAALLFTRRLGHNCDAQTLAGVVALAGIVDCGTGTLALTRVHSHAADLTRPGTLVGSGASHAAHQQHCSAHNQNAFFISCLYLSIDFRTEGWMRLIALSYSNQRDLSEVVRSYDR